MLGMRRLEDEGCRRVIFYRETADDRDRYGPVDGGDRRLGYTFIPPAAAS